VNIVAKLGMRAGQIRKLPFGTTTGHGWNQM
jgi:hypothetical protein